MGNPFNVEQKIKIEICVKNFYISNFNQYFPILTDIEQKNHKKTTVSRSNDMDDSHSVCQGCKSRLEIRSDWPQMGQIRDF